MKADHTSADATGAPIVTAIGVFPNYLKARQAVEALRRAGFRDDQIGVMGPDVPVDDTGLPAEVAATHWSEGAGIGAAAGGLAGLGLGAAATLGLMTPLGPVVAGGAILAWIASAAVGAGVGTVIGTIVGLGIPDEDAPWYAQEVHAGRIIVTVRAANWEVAQSILNQNGAINRPKGAASDSSVPTTY